MTTPYLLFLIFLFWFLHFYSHIGFLVLPSMPIKHDAASAGIKYVLDKVWHYDTGCLKKFGSL